MGRPKIFENETELWKQACNYFDWCVENPLYKIVYRGTREIKTPKMRAMTLQGLCIYLNIEYKTFCNYGKRPDFLHIITRIRSVIWCYKFEGAAAGFLNANIISRELGLTSRNKIDTHVKVGMDFERSYQ